MINVRTLGCHGGQLPGFSQVSFLINDKIVLDAGSITQSLTLKEQHHINSILITHGHLDHIKDLCFLGENLYLAGSRHSVPVYSSEAILTDITRNLMNGIVWPNFSQIPNKRKPIFSFRSIKQTLSINGLKIKAVPVDHSHSALGYIVSDNKGTIVFSGDTGPTQKLWQEANKHKNLRAVFLELSFPAGLADLAWKTRHISVLSLVKEISKIKNSKIPIYLYHLKPVYYKKIQDEIRRLGIKRLKILKPNRTLIF